MNINIPSQASLSDSDRYEINLQLLKTISSEFTVTGVNGFGSLVNYSSLSDEPVHRWFRYREGYSIELVKRLITGLPNGSIILDPFCGCGTSLIASQSLGYESYGFDVNPLSTLIAKVKTREYGDSELKQMKSLGHEFECISSSSPSEDPPPFSIVNKVFHPEILSCLLKIRKRIKTIQENHIRDFFFVAWLSILERVSNVYKEGNGIKYRNRKRTPNGYVTISDQEWQDCLFPKDKFKFVISSFAEQFSVMIEDARAYNRKLPKAHVINASAENVHEYLPSNSVAYIVFSPPYCNCFNYFKIFKVELWMGEFVKTYKELQSLNRRAIRSHVETRMQREYDEPISYVNNFVELIDRQQLWDKRIPEAVQGYFMDMNRIMESLGKVLKPEGSCVIVVGNSAYSGILIPTDVLLAKVASERGFHVDRISVARHLTTSSQQKLNLADRKEYLRESLVILKKPDERLAEKQLVYVDEIPEIVEITKDKVFVIKNNGLCNVTHKFHRFPAKFIPHIPRWAINKYLSDKGQVILDPFVGSGTTLVESMLAGQNSYGIDVDPIARLISRSKTTPISPELLDACVNDIILETERRQDGIFKPTIPTLNHWFSEQAVKDLSVIRDIIETYKSNQILYQFLLAAFLSIIRRASNADNQTQKSYVSHTYKKIPESAKLLFKKALIDYSQRLKDFDKSIKYPVNSNVLPYKDARKFADSWKKDSLPEVDMAITSPPYIKSVDYVYNQMTEYFWIGDIFNMENQLKQNEYKKNYIGTQKISKKEYANLEKTGIDSIDLLCEKISRKNLKHAYIVANYFRDIMTHLGEMTRVLRKESHYIMVVGDSMVSNEPIMVHELIQDCAKAIGFIVESVFGYEIRNRHMRFPRQGRGGIVRYDWVIDMKMEA